MTKNKTDLRFKVNEIFRWNYNSDKKVCLNRGGTSSGKTYSINHIALNWLLTGSAGQAEVWGVDESGIFTVARKFGTSLRVSVMRDFETIALHYGLLHKIKRNKNERSYTFGKRVVEFIGVDDVTKVAKGPRRQHLYMNECDEFTLRDFEQLALRTNKRIFIDFNPDDEDCWMNVEIENKRFHLKKDVDVFISTYKHNLAFLSQNTVEEIEYLQESNPMAWAVYGLGQYGRIKGRIFENFEVIPDIPDGAKFHGRGLDFGFTNSYTSLVDIWQYNKGVVWDELLYERGLLNRDIHARMEQLELEKYSLIVADSAEPKTIEELTRFGWSIVPCSKGKDSVRRRIDVAQGMKIYITARSQNLIREMKKFRWAEDRNGVSLKQPVKKDDHAIDAALYGTDHFMGLPNVAKKFQSSKSNSGLAGIRNKRF